MTRGRMPRVIAFGFDQWERYGLWPAWERASRFTMCELGVLCRDTGIRRVGPEERRRLGEAYLRFIEDRESRSGPVDLAFFYSMWTRKA